ncbi:MAG: ATP-binding protein [Bacteroidia bacterium]|nr:ATP-binding protein [Bacteroidia bacterium]
MELSVAPFVVSVAYSLRFRKFASVNKLPQWEKLFRNAFFLSVFLFATEFVIQAVELMKWIWHLYLILLIVIPFRQKELQPLRMFIFAFVPYVVFAFVSDLTEIISNDFFKTNETYFKNASALAIIWFVAILYSQNRQSKAAEKERIKRQHEDELNRAIAIRKIELEVLVSERTAELTKQKEELEFALEELRNTQSQLIQSEKMASLGELTAGIAHEIQNPLNFVNNFSEVSNELLEEMQAEIEQGNSAEVKQIVKDLKSNLEKINHHGKRADSIVKGMLLHSRASTGQKEPTDINALADEYLRLAYHGLRAKDKSFNARFDTDFDESIGKINVIPQDMGRVILNLLTNAFYAVTEKKKALGDSFQPAVTISTRKVGKNLEIRVTDNGNGIPAKIIDKIFQPFFSSKPTGVGTGLGLSMCYEIVTKGHGGKIEVENKEGEGAAMIVTIPT